MSTSQKLETPQARVTVDRYTDIVGPSNEMLGPVEDGGTIEYLTVPGCWGPMITPALRSGHEVTLPVAVAGAEVGDSIAITVEELEPRSAATSSGTSIAVDDRFLDDPFLTAICPSCKEAGRSYLNPESYIDGFGEQAVRCVTCGAEVSPFKLGLGYTIAFDYDNSVGITVGKQGAEAIAADARAWMGLTEWSKQHPIVALAKADLVGMSARCRVSIGNLGTIPPIDLPSSHNCGDFGEALVGAKHEWGVTRDELDQRTDGHMDIDSVRKGSVLISPVRVDGGGLYAGDVHAMIGDGEIAGHAADISARLVIRVKVLKGVSLDGPVLLPPVEDLPFLAKPFSASERQFCEALAKRHHTTLEGGCLPIQVLGSAAQINEAVDNGVMRAAKLLRKRPDELRNRATIAGGVEIGRLPGLVQLSMLIPEDDLGEVGILDVVRTQYEQPR